MSNEALRRQEWEALYAEIRATLAALGREDAFGEGDFWVVDDDWGGFRHKVCVTRLAFLTPSLAQAVQGVLRRMHLPWEVILALDFPDAARPPDGEGVLVSKSSIEPRWDAGRLRRDHGAQFRWPE